ncbi:MAG TPA: MFS transporter [Opitutaceae bacterium]|nr:MFS transporter [Opitutaceae bacterium]
MTLPWAALYFIENISNSGPLVFTLKKFFEDPMLIGFLTSLNVAFNFMVGVVTSYMSDRIWTRFGRRKPFLLIGWSGVILSLVLLPLATNGWSLVAIIILYQLSADIAKPLEPLYNEVIPPAQRGRAAMVRSVVQNLVGLVFFGLLLMQFDRVYTFEVLGTALRTNGEAVLYWSAALVILVALFFLFFCVKETPPETQRRREAFRLRVFFRDLFARRDQAWLYALYITPLIAAPGVDVFRPLLQTEQLGFSKADVGKAASIGLIVSLLVFYPLAGFLTDRIARMRLFQLGLIGPAVANLLLFLYLRYYSDYTLTFSLWIAFGLLTGIFPACLYVVWGPLIYDYIPTHRFGTTSAGLSFVGGVTSFLVMNAGGLWINFFTGMFGPRGASKFDYSSVYILQIIGTLTALGITMVFTYHERCGRIQRLGQLEHQEPDPALRR